MLIILVKGWISGVKMVDICDKCGSEMRVANGKYIYQSVYTKTLLICDNCKRIIIGNDNIGFFRVKAARDKGKYNGNKIVDEIFKELDDELLKGKN